MPWALDIGGVCREKLDVDPAGRFAPDPNATWRPCAASVAIGDVWSGTEFVRPAAPASTLASQRAALAAERYARETGGIYFKAAAASAPALVTSDETSQAKMTSSYVAALNGHWVDGTPWKASDGSFVALTSADMQAMALTLLGYVAQCYANEARLMVALEADLAADITQGWPSNGAPAIVPASA